MRTIHDMLLYAFTMAWSMRTAHDMLLQLLQLSCLHCAATAAIAVALLAPPCAATTTVEQLSSGSGAKKCNAAERPEKSKNCGLLSLIASQEVSEPQTADGAQEIVGSYADWGCKGEAGQPDEGRSARGRHVMWVICSPHGSHCQTAFNSASITRRFRMWRLCGSIPHSQQLIVSILFLSPYNLQEAKIIG